MAYFTKQEAYDSARKTKLSTESYSNKLASSRCCTHFRRYGAKSLRRLGS